MFIRITKKVFKDLAIYMIFLGVLVGIAFPFFIRIFGVPGTIAFQPMFFVGCIAAGILLATLNIGLARKVVGSRIRELCEQMKHVEGILSNRKPEDTCEQCTPEACCIKVDSDDELGDSALSFNRLIHTLSDVLNEQRDLQAFSEMLTSNLELDVLANKTLHYMIDATQACGGAILQEHGGELSVVASYAVDQSKSTFANSIFRYTVEKQERQLICLPEDIVLEGVLTQYRPRELVIEPIIYKQVVVGVVLLAGVTSFSIRALKKLSLYGPILSMSFNNAITHQQMQQLAALDALTGIYNRRFGYSRLQEEFSRSVRTKSAFSLIMLDIDHFKAVNDTYGHMVGDKLIVLITKNITSAIREGDVTIRYGGEEFLCLLPGASQQDANFVAERIRVMVKDTILKSDDHEIRVTVSLGTATYPGKDISNIQQFINLADEAMYSAKRSGRNRVVSV
ncbi:MAG: GGDEF domain-containing protein [Eubacteriales bacterium]|nr:GGDEF domain-containing protein [Eubacteriales bacterium]